MCRQIMRIHDHELGSELKANFFKDSNITISTTDTIEPKGIEN